MSLCEQTANCALSAENRTSLMQHQWKKKHEQLTGFILANILDLAWRHTCFQTECNWDRERFIAEKIQDKHSISPLGDMQLHLQRKWKDNLSGCVHCRLKSDYFSLLLWTRIWSSYFCPNKHSIWFSPRFDEQWKHQKHAIVWGIEGKKKNQTLGYGFILLQSSRSHRGTKCNSYYCDLEGVSSQCDCEDANLVNGAWNRLLLLAWHSISSSRVYVLGFAVGATHYGAPRTCQHPTTQSLLMPPLLTSVLA